jgi:cysteine sulfinate desulfinase/cysteine desulfurase-like protein
VLLAMGQDAKEASSSLRISLSRETTREELQQAASAVAESVAALRALG